MFANCTQHPTQVEEFMAIQVQGCHDCPSYYGTAYDDYEVLAPGKVPCPTLATRMEEWYKAPCLWI